VPRSTPSQDDQIARVLGSAAQHLVAWCSRSQGHANLQRPEVARAAQALEKLPGPSGPLVLWLIDVARRRQRSLLLGWAGTGGGDMEHVQLRRGGRRHLRGRRDGRTGGRRAVVRQKDPVERPGRPPSVWANENDRARRTLEDGQSRAAQRPRR